MDERRGRKEGKKGGEQTGGEERRGERRGWIEEKRINAGPDLFDEKSQ
jgi:hypothetical protein